MHKKQHLNTDGLAFIYFICQIIKYNMYIYLVHNFHKTKPFFHTKNSEVKTLTRTMNSITIQFKLTLFI